MATGKHRRPSAERSSVVLSFIGSHPWRDTSDASLLSATGFTPQGEPVQHTKAPRRILPDPASPFFAASDAVVLVMSPPLDPSIAMWGISCAVRCCKPLILMGSAPLPEEGSAAFEEARRKIPTAQLDTEDSQELVRTAVNLRWNRWPSPPSFPQSPAYV